MDEKKGFSILAIVIGGVTIYLGKMLLTMISNMLLFGVGPLTAFGHRVHSVTPHTSFLPAAMAAMISWWVGLIVGAFISMAGGAVAGSMAPASKAEHGLLAGVGVSLVSFLLLLRWLSVNHHLIGGSAHMLPFLAPSVISLLLTVFFAWLGGRMVAGGSNRRYRGN